MQTRHSRASIVSMAAIALCFATSLHEGVGHGVTAWARGDLVTELTSNHLSSSPSDKIVDAGGTIANLIVGTISMLLSRSLQGRANWKYFFWIFGALNLMSGAGYFLFSGTMGMGDWEQVIAGVPHYAAWRVAMSVGGAALYVSVLWWSMRSLQPFLASRSEYNLLGRLPYLTACAVDCLAGAFDPLGWKLFLLSTMPAVFGGFSGLLWADALLPKIRTEQPLSIAPSRALWVAAVVLVALFVLVLGRGVEFKH